MRVAITGIGVVSPWWSGGLGRGAPPPLPSPAARERAFEHEWEVPLDAVPADKSARIGRLDRLCRLMLAASYLAVGDAGLEIDASQADRVGLCFGTGLGCLLTNAEFYARVVEQGPKAASPRLFAYTVSSAAAGEVSIALGIKGPNTTQHAGFAAGVGALGYGFDLIESGKADVVLAGAGDACGPALLEALRDMGLLKTTAHSRPFVDAIAGIDPSEAAVVFVLEAESRTHSAAKRGALALHVTGYAAGFEPTLASRTPNARGIAETMRRALAQSGTAPRDVDAVVTSAHGTACDAAELAAIRAVLGDRALLVAPKMLFGETFAASSLLGVALIEAVRRAPSTAGRAPSLSLPRSAGEGVDASRSSAGEGADSAAVPAFRLDGTPIDAAEAAPRLAEAAVVMVNSVCYSGNIVSLLLTRRE